MERSSAAGMLSERKLGPPAQTNGKGGGDDRRRRVQGRATPDAQCELVVTDGDTLVFDGDMDTAASPASPSARARR